MNVKNEEKETKDLNRHMAYRFWGVAIFILGLYLFVPDARQTQVPLWAGLLFLGLGLLIWYSCRTPRQRNPLTIGSAWDSRR